MPDLFRAPGGPARERDYLLGLLADEDVALFVAESGGAFLGVVHVFVWDAAPVPVLIPRPCTVIENVAVRVDRRRAGVDDPGARVGAG